MSNELLEELSQYVPDLNGNCRIPVALVQTVIERLRTSAESEQRTAVPEGWRLAPAESTTRGLQAAQTVEVLEIYS